MWYLYVLKRAKRANPYIGYSSNLRTRLRAHNQGMVDTTTGCPWRLVYYEAYEHKTLAQLRERILKQRGRVWRALKERILPRKVLGDGVPIEE